MRSFNDTFVANLNARHSGGLFFKTAALTVAPGDTRYYADLQHPVVIDGHTYTPMPMSWSGLNQSTSMAILAIQVTVPNIDGQASAFIEANSLIGQEIVLMIAHRDLLGVTNAREVLSLQVMAVQWKQWETATFTCGINLALNETLPAKVVTRAQFPGTPDLARRASVL